MVTNNLMRKSFIETINLTLILKNYFIIPTTH